MKMNSRNAFAKCRDDGFAICCLDVDKGWMGVEPAEKTNGLYYYIVKASSKFGVLSLHFSIGIRPSPIGEHVELASNVF